MRTEIDRRFSWGFILSEQDLRRIVQTCNDHAAKLSQAGVRQLLSAKLRDGAVVESPDPDDILSLENFGTKAVERLSIAIREDSQEPAWSIDVEFQDGFKNPDSWNSVRLRVVGASRDWAFLAAADLEERIKKARTIAWSALLGSRGAFLSLVVIIMLGTITSLAFSVSRVKTGDAGQALEAAQKAGTVTDAVSALVFLEKYRASHQPSLPKVFGPMILVMLAPMGAFVALFWGLPLLYSSYNFYWGDYVGVFDKRRAAARVLWTVVVLGLLVSVLGGLLLKYFFG